MRRSIILLPAFFLLVLGCARSLIPEVSYWDPQRNMVREKGYWLSVVSDSGTSEWVQHGTWRSYYGDGTKNSEIRFRRGRIVGTAKYWHPNGQVRQVVPYNDHGLPHGAVRWWDTNGVLLVTSAMTNGTGKDYYFYPDGRIRKIVHFHNGTPGLAENFSE